MNIPSCSKCKEKFCTQEIQDKKNLPDFCPIKEKSGLLEEARQKYSEADIVKFYIPATLTEKEAYEKVRGNLIPVRPRVAELIEFAKKMKFTRLGIAFCTGLSDEALLLTEILEKAKFKVYSALCKCGNYDKTRFGVPGDYKIGGEDSFEAGCNPSGQAYLLNDARTELNIIMGLCIGHDILFTLHSKTPVTTLIVKDRYTGHNPAVSLYSSYHKNAFLREPR